MKYKRIKEEAYEANKQLPLLDLVLFTFGNASAIDRDLSVFAIKPSGVPYSELRAEDMVVVDFENRIVEGTLRPSSDTKTHAVLYQTWNEVGGICHTHSTYATSWAQAQMPIPILGTTHADHLTIDVPCAPVMDDQSIQGDYEHQTGKQIINYFNSCNLNPSEVEMVLIAGHAPFTWGASAAKAVYNSAVLEEVARMAYLTLQINPEVAGLKEALKSKHYERKHGDKAYYGQE